MIIDCFPFFNELDLLEIRLHELQDVVDVFVLSEATLTFTGQPKPLYYQENQDRFAEFSDRIRHVVVSDYRGINLRDPRSMDRGQKQRGLDWMHQTLNPGPSDMVIMADADEIPRASTIQQASKETDWTAAMIEMPMFYYYLNCRCLGRPGSWRNPRLLRPSKRIHYNSTRKGPHDKEYWNAGWHFSFLHDTIEDIQYKVASYTHAPQYDNADYMQGVKDRVQNMQDIFCRKRYRFECLEDLSYLPQYVKNNLERFSKHIRGSNGTAA